MQIFVYSLQVLLKLPWAAAGETAIPHDKQIVSSVSGVGSQLFDRKGPMFSWLLCH